MKTKRKNRPVHIWCTGLNWRHSSRCLPDHAKHAWLEFARAVSVLLLILTIFPVSQPAVCQDVSVAFTGSVLDETGAAVVNATVSARDIEKGTVFRAQTDNAGFFNIQRLTVGTYDLTVAAQGFQTAEHPPVTVVLNQILRVDFRLKVGPIRETVAINSVAPLLQGDTSQVSTLVDSHANIDLPLAIRNYIQLTLLVPGSVNPNPQTMNSADSTGPLAAGRPYINGNREQANSFLLDGMDNNQVSDNLGGFTPSVDAIQEFNVITQNAPAEFGNFQGGIISVSVKSGTNNYHGDVFEFFRNDALNANNWANNFQGVPRPTLRWNMYGGTLGGPILKKKLFFFVDYQGQRFAHPATSSAFTLFTGPERRGDFSQLLIEKGIQLYNPFQLDANGNRTPFPNNHISLSMLDPVARNLFSSSLYPLPMNNNLENNFINTARSYNNMDQGDIRVDYKLSSTDWLYSRVSEGAQDNPGTNSFKLFFDSFNVARLENGVINWTHTFTPNVLSEARVGGNYVQIHNGGFDKGLGSVGKELGIANANDHGAGLLAIGLAGGVVTGFGNANIGTAVLFADTVFQYDENLVITRGRHVLHTGFQYWRQRINTNLVGGNGRTGFMNFSGRFTSGPDQLAVSGDGTGAGEADFFLGLPDSFGRGSTAGTWGQRASVFGAYIQDDWRATRNLTLNLGVRYENHTPWVEVQDRQVNFELITGQIQFAGQHCIYINCRALYDPYNLGFDFQPRLGFAWNPSFLDKKTVLRGAYTISSYLEGTGTNLRLPLNPPFASAEFETDYHDANLPVTRTEQGLLPPTTDPFQNAIIRLWDRNIQPAVSQQWNLTVQHEFTTSTTVQAGYLGQHGTHLMVPMPYLQSQLHADGEIAPSPYLSGNPSLESKLSQVSGTASVGNMRYDAMQAILQKRLGSGLQGQVAYTYSKCMTDSIGYFGSWGGQATPSSAYWQNLYNPRAEWGPCYFDVTHSLTGYGVYELPVGRNRKWGKDLRPVLNGILGNWQVGAIAQVHGGFPLTIFADDASGTNSRGSRANCNGASRIFGKKPAFDSGNFIGYQWFDPSVYGPAAPGTFGTCSVGTVRGPGLRTADISLEKEFLFSQSKKLEFRVEFFNFTNTPILNAPGVFLGSGLGLINSSQGERNIQLALKLYY